LRVRLVFLIIALFAVVAIGRVVLLQTEDNRHWARLSEEVDLQYRSVKATRGNIYAGDGSLLATSLPFYRLAMDPGVAAADIYKRGIDSLAWLLSRQFRDQPAAYYRRKINDARLSGKRYIILNTKLVKYADKKRMADWPIFREGRNKGGIIFEKVDQRYRPFSYLGHRTVGFVNANQEGAGLEYSFNRELAGEDGSALYQKMAGGSWRPIYDGSEVRPVDGYDLQTTIDINLQDVAESALLNALREHNAEYGCVVFMEVQSGEIKAMSNLTRGRRPGEYREVFNYAVQGLTDPGSTFKLLSMIALLDGTNIDLDDSIDTGDGAFRFYSSTMRDHKPGGHGVISVREAFELSSNVAMSRLVNDHFGSNPDRFIHYIRQAGMTQPLGFQMRGEGTPRIKTPADPSWSGISLPWMSIGYEVELTPLQILSLYNAIANDGRLIRPIIVRSIVKADREVETMEAEVLRSRICSRSTLKKVRSLLEGVVERGTAVNVRTPHYRIAGKTGTAQKIEKGRYTRKYYTSFVGYFPADKPKYSCIVVIDDPKGFRQYGSNVAGPVFREIADLIYSQDLQLHPEELAGPENETPKTLPVIRAGFREELELICDELDVPFKSTAESDWVHTRVENERVLWKADQVQSGVVPDVSGMTPRDAVYLLENLVLRVHCRGWGRVVQQSLPPGRRAGRGDQITLKFG
jgi:cell division protein FtsI (penicillin-binding protein 3)